MSIVMSSIYDYDDISLFGGILEEEVPTFWGELEEGLEKVGVPTIPLPTAPRSGAFEGDSAEINFEVPSPLPNWMLGDNLESLVNNDFLEVVNKTQSFSSDEQSKMFSLPPSPSGSMDSGVASPGSSGSYSSNAGSPQMLDLTDETEFYPGLSEDFDADMLLQELGIEILDQPIQTQPEVVVPVPSSESFIFVEDLKTTPSVVKVHSFPTLEPSELSALLSEDSTYNTPTIQPVVTKPTVTPIAPKPTIPTTPKAKCGRKSKVTSTSERKERKREQNKNAAIRYREKKRREICNLDGEYDIVKSQNTQLHDKVKQVSREINYLRELMVEVYRIKGLIP